MACILHYVGNYLALEVPKLLPQPRTDPSKVPSHVRLNPFQVCDSPHAASCCLTSFSFVHGGLKDPPGAHISPFPLFS